MTATDPVRDALLALCADPARDFGPTWIALDPAARAALVSHAIAQRAGPLLQEALGRAGLGDEGGEALAGDARFHSLNCLRQGVALARLTALLRRAGLAPLALKGVGLAFEAYPQPSLRPLRDVDLLLAPDDAERAQHAIVAAPGYRVAPDAAAMTAQPRHQLAGLEDTETGLAIEIHRALAVAPWPGEGALIALMEASADTVTIAGERVRIPAPIANMLHLVEHATLHHFFENGPLILSDLHYLARSPGFDEAALVQQAHALDLFHPLCLVAAIARRYGAGWIPAGLESGIAAAQPHIAFALAAMMLDHEQMEGRKMMRRIARAGGGQAGPRKALARALSPDPRQLALHAPSFATGRWRWLGYPGWLADRAAQYGRATLRDRAATAAREAERLDAWLRER